jgi:hypothetical protein
MTSDVKSYRHSVGDTGDTFLYGLDETGNSVSVAAIIAAGTQYPGFVYGSSTMTIAVNRPLLALPSQCQPVSEPECPYCEGTGRDDDARLLCPMCHGSGRISGTETEIRLLFAIFGFPLPAAIADSETAIDAELFAADLYTVSLELADAKTAVWDALVSARIQGMFGVEYGLTDAYYLRKALGDVADAAIALDASFPEPDAIRVHIDNARDYASIVQDTCLAR